MDKHTAYLPCESARVFEDWNPEKISCRIPRKYTEKQVIVIFAE